MLTEDKAQTFKDLTQGVGFSATWIPYLQSRNAPGKNPDQPKGWESLNWRITLRRGGSFLETDYSAGIGHLPEACKRILKREGYDSASLQCRHTRDSRVYLDHVLEHGRESKFLQTSGIALGGKPILPDWHDVVHSLVSDADVLNYASFEDWADCFGYEKDSRRAEGIYRECLRITLQLKSIIGDKELEQLRELFQDY